MAIAPVSKFLIAVHKSVKDDFLVQLQRLGIFHITQTGFIEPETEDESLVKLLATIEVLSGASGKKPSERIALPRAEYEEITRSYDPQEILQRIDILSIKRRELEHRKQIIEDDLRRLQPWAAFSYAPASLEESGVKFIFGRFTDSVSYESATRTLADKPVTFQVMSEDDGIYTVVAVAKEVFEDVNLTLAKLNWQTVELGGVTAPPGEVIENLKLEHRLIDEEIVRVDAEIGRLSDELPRLKAKADGILNENKRQAVEQKADKTELVYLITGWVKDRDIRRLEQLVKQVHFATMVQVQPERDEQPPVALMNQPLWRPFELVLELYQLPLPDEMDPTWLIAPFFSVFFALCLTDAGYGIVLAILAYLLLRKMRDGSKLLNMIFICALLTIPVGAMVGGWFGDIPDRLGVDWLVAFKNRVMLFDPMKEPMKFFILSVALGYLQLVTGIAFELADAVRLKRYADAFLGQLPWLVFLITLVIRLVLGRSLSPEVNSWLVILVLGAVAAIIVFTRREQETMPSQWMLFLLLFGLLVFFASRLGWIKSEFLSVRWLVLAVFVVMLGYAWFTLYQRRDWSYIKVILGLLSIGGLILYFLRFLPAVVAGLIGMVFYFFAPVGARLIKKLVWGGYALYGASSYVGVLLSYIRLMALGMCTGGVAMAINVIAWMLMPVPVIGVFLALIVLLVGHTYNIAVNVLGAFVHSLRLQYVEFFPRFYTGGGEPFQPFREINRFVILKT